MRYLKKCKIGLMKKRIKIEKRGNNYYAYEVTPKYDKKIQNTRYRKRYLGIVESFDADNNPIIKRKWKRSIKKENSIPLLTSLIEESFSKKYIHHRESISNYLISLQTKIFTGNPKVTRVNKSSIPVNCYSYTIHDSDFHYCLIIPRKGLDRLSVTVEPGFFSGDDGDGLLSLLFIKRVFTKRDLLRHRKLDKPVNSICCDFKCSRNETLNTDNERKDLHYIILIFHELVWLNHNIAGVDETISYGLTFLMRAIIDSYRNKDIEYLMKLYFELRNYS